MNAERKERILQKEMTAGQSHLIFMPVKKKLLFIWAASGIVAAALLAGVFWLITPPTYHDSWPVDQELSGYYRNSYKANRKAFRDACIFLQKNIPGTVAAAIPVPGGKEQLTIDLCDVPPTPGARDRLLIMTSGLHGVEGYAGSAVQRVVMRKLVIQAKKRPELLFLHGINPYGMQEFRRVTENNVDLNRNFDKSPALYSTPNPGYVDVYSLLNPEGKANPESVLSLTFPLRALRAIITKGMTPLRQAVLEGQYRFPRGIFYGGSKPAVQRALLDPLFERVLVGRRVVAIIDLHTGFGKRGKAHLFPNSPPNEKVRKWTEELFQGYKVDWPDANSYAVHGEFCEYVGQLVSESTAYIPMVVEYGTMDTQTTKGSIRSIHITLLENQAHQYGCTTRKACQIIRKDFREMYFPESLSWRSHILASSITLFDHVLKRIVIM